MLLLVFKLAAVIMILYIILVKWDFQFYIKLLGLAVFGASGLFLCLYDFLIYDNENKMCIRDRVLLYHKKYRGQGVILFRLPTASASR